MIDKSKELVLILVLTPEAKNVSLYFQNLHWVFYEQNPSHYSNL